MHIDRERFLRAALLLNLGGAPLGAGCIITDDGAEGQPVEQQQTSGGEQAPAYQEQPQQTYRGGPPVQVVGPAQEGGYAPAYEGGPVYEGGGPSYEGGPVDEGGPVYE